MRKFLAQVFDEFSEIRFAASSLAFSTLLSLIPFLIIVLAVLQSIGGLETFYPRIEGLMINYLKEATGSTVSQYIKNSLSHFQPRTLGVTGGVLLLLASLGLIRHIDMAFHRIWKIKITTPIYSRIWIYWIILVTIPIILALFTGLKSVNYISNLSQQVEHQVLFTLCTSLFLFALYKIIPHTTVHFRSAAIPAILVAITMNLVQNSFLWLSMKVFKQNKIYGSLASFPIFLVWLLTVWYVILTGVSLSAFLQNRQSKKISEVTEPV
jgi:membrane protein